MSRLGVWSNRHPVVLDSVVTLVVVAAAVFAQWGTNIPDPDTFYHARAAMMIRDARGPVQSFPYFTETVLADAYVDHHFLYHVFLVPFLWLGSMVGMRVATIFAIGVAAFALLRLLRAWGSRWGPLIVPLLMLTRNLWFRLNLQKAPAISLVFFILGIAALSSKKYRPLLVGIVAALYVLLYNGWPVLVLAAAAMLIGEIGGARVAGGSERGAVVRALQTAGGLVVGIVVGLIVHPNFPANIPFSYLHIVKIGAINAKQLFGLGAEWYPYAPLELLKDSALAVIFALSALGIFFWSLRGRKSSSVSSEAIGRALGVTLLVAIFLPLAVKSRRHIEYAMPAIILWIGYFFGMSQNFLQSEVVPKIRAALKRFHPAPILVGAAVLAFALLMLPAADLIRSRTEFERGFSDTHMQDAAAWLDVNTPQDSVVLNVNWAYPPFLLYHSLHNRYVLALDPTFMYARSPERFLRWQEISQGKFHGDLLAAVQSFGAVAVLVTDKYDDAYKLFAANPAFREAFRNQYAVIFVPVQERFAFLP